MAGRRGKRIYSTAKWKRLRNLAIIRARFTCEGCGRSGIELQGHHRVALENGGAPYSLDNIKVVCRRCHMETHNPTPDEVQAWKQLVFANA